MVKKVNKRQYRRQESKLLAQNLQSFVSETFTPDDKLVKTGVWMCVCVLINKTNERWRIELSYFQRELVGC